MIKIEPIKAFSDNYIWLVTTNEGLLVVDPGDAAPVESYLKDNNMMMIAAIVITATASNAVAARTVATGSAAEIVATAASMDLWGPLRPQMFDLLPPLSMFQRLELQLLATWLRLPFLGRTITISDSSRLV